MAPKKSTKAKTSAVPAKQNSSGATKDSETKDNEIQKPNREESQAVVNAEGVAEEQVKNDSKEQSSKKRKNDAEHDQPPKAPRRSTRGARVTQPSTQQLLKYILSQEAESLCQPDDETEDIKSRGNIRTYSSTVLSPFEELLCAIILSRPISHRLGMRTIRTVLNDPYNFTTPKAIQAAGSEKRHQALWDAKTQHKGKTADQIGQIADVVLSKFTSSKDKAGTRMLKALEDGSNDIDTTLDLLKENIKGLGKTGLDIFHRRVQWIWDVGYPFVDDRTSQSLKKLGLPEDAEELVSLLDKTWNELGTKHLAGEDEKTRKRRAFVVILERATSADLEGKSDELLEAAAIP